MLGQVLSYDKKTLLLKAQKVRVNCKPTTPFTLIAPQNKKNSASILITQKKKGDSLLSST